MINTIEYFTQHLIVLRILAGMSEKNLSNVLGLTQAHISNMERGRRQMAKTIYFAIQYVLEDALRNEYNPYLRIYLDLVNRGQAPEDAPERVRAYIYEHRRISMTRDWILNDLLPRYI